MVTAIQEAFEARVVGDVFGLVADEKLGVHHHVRVGDEEIALAALLALEVERHEGETPWQLYLSTECGHDQIGCIDLTGKDRKQLIKLLQGG